MPKWVAALLIIGVLVVIASRVSDLIIMLIAAAVIAYILSSFISAGERLGIRRNVAVILLFVVAALVGIAAHFILTPYLKQEIVNAYARIPAFSRQIESTLLLSAQNNEHSNPMVANIIRKVTDAVIGPGGFLDSTRDVSGILTQAGPFIMGLILVPFFVFFLLKDWPVVVNKVMDWIPASYVETTLSVITEINILVGKYLRGLAADCLFVGILASLGLWLVGINYPIMLGILSGVANIIPYFGPIVGCLASCLVALMQDNSLDALLNVILLYIFIKLADDLFIQPLVIGKSVKLHPMLLVITIVAGEKLFGVSGMILGVPVVTAAQKTASILIEHRRETLRREAAGKLMLGHLDNPPVRPV